MAVEIPQGTKVHVRVPASSANLGPGFDTLGIALSMYDEIDVEVIPSGLEIEIHGEGAETLPRDGSHLVVRAIRAGLKAADATAPGLKVTCYNTIPQARGLGSSAAAAVGGVAAANGLVGHSLTEEQVVQLSSAFEGHPDNASASVLGDAVVSWTDVPVDGQTLPQFHAVGIHAHESINATAFIPSFHASTDAVRKVLPSDVTHQDARFNVSRASLLTVALQSHPEYLWEATRDRLHQPYRADVLPVATEWVNRLRNRGYAAYLSGAGPTVMVLHTEPIADGIISAAREDGLRVEALHVAGPVETTVVA